MAITAETLGFAVLARKDGVDFSHTATLGRQEPYILDGQTVERIFADYGIPLPEGDGERALAEDRGYTDGLLRRLGAQEIVSIDASPFEGCTVVHDMNEPLPEALRRRFTAVLDIGTLEHIFNASLALQSLMEMVAPGGHLVLAVPGNNWFGHGFYQFSPEFFYRSLTPANGFEVRRMLALPERRPERWYSVADPSRIGSRVHLVNSAPTLLYVSARRVSEAGAGSTVPQQSDYIDLWRSHDGVSSQTAEVGAAGAPAPPSRLPFRQAARAGVHRHLPRSVRIAIERHVQRRYTWYVRAGLRRVRPQRLRD